MKNMNSKLPRMRCEALNVDLRLKREASRRTHAGGSNVSGKKIKAVILECDARIRVRGAMKAVNQAEKTKSRKIRIILAIST